MANQKLPSALPFGIIRQKYHPPHLESHLQFSHLTAGPGLSLGAFTDPFIGLETALDPLKAAEDITNPQ